MHRLSTTSRHVDRLAASAELALADAVEVEQVLDQARHVLDLARTVIDGVGGGAVLGHRWRSR